MARRRYELTDNEQAIIAPMLPNNPRGVPRVDDRRVINGTLCRFRSSSAWTEIPERYGPPTTYYNRFAPAGAKRGSGIGRWPPFPGLKR